MKIDLYGKTAIVTGSTDGIGFAIARGLALCGATVVINGRKPAGVDRAVAALRAAVPKGGAARGSHRPRDRHRLRCLGGGRTLM